MTVVLMQNPKTTRLDRKEISPNTCFEVVLFNETRGSGNASTVDLHQISLWNSWFLGYM